MINGETVTPNACWLDPIFFSSTIFKLSARSLVSASNYKQSDFPEFSRDKTEEIQIFGSVLFRRQMFLL